MKTTFTPPFKLVLLFFLYSLLAVSQNNTKDYYIEIQEGVSLGILSKNLQQDGTIIIQTGVTAINNFVNSKKPFVFEKAFPTSVTPRLQRVYFATFNISEDLTDFNHITEIENIIERERPQLLDDFVELSEILSPDDYQDIITGGNNAALELINAPLAWSITTGDPNVLLGIVDSKFDLQHEELQSEVVFEVDTQNGGQSHGTGVASLMSGAINNGAGIASIGYNTKIDISGYSLGTYAISLICDGELQDNKQFIKL